MVITKSTTKGPNVSITKAKQGPHSKNYRGPAPKAQEGGTPMPHHGVRGAKVTVARMGAVKTGK